MLQIYRIGLQDEMDFLLKLQDDLTALSVEKTADKFCPVDYVVKQNGAIFLYMEIKNRNLDLRNYDTLMIGRGKLENILRIRQDVILIWVCKTTGTLYWIFFAKWMLDLKVHLLKGKRVAYIGKMLCSTGYDDLLSNIHDCSTST